VGDPRRKNIRGNDGGIDNRLCWRAISFNICHMKAWLERMMRPRWCALAAVSALVVLLVMLASVPGTAAQPHIAKTSGAPAGLPGTSLPASADITATAPAPAAPDLRVSRDSTAFLIVLPSITVTLASAGAELPCSHVRPGVPCRDGVLLPLLS
jgi:hypothetical protein